MVNNRGHERPGLLAKIIFALIVAASISVVWLGLRGLEKEPNGPPIGSAALPGQAVQRAGAQPHQRPAMQPTPPPG